MITAFRKKTVIRKDGSIAISIPELDPGAQAEVIILVDTEKPKQSDKTRPMTAAELLSSGLAGMWAKRKDLGNSLQFAQELRQTAERRHYDQ